MSTKSMQGSRYAWLLKTQALIHQYVENGCLPFAMHRSSSLRLSFGRSTRPYGRFKNLRNTRPEAKLLTECLAGWVSAGQQMEWYGR